MLSKKQLTKVRKYAISAGVFLSVLIIGYIILKKMYPEFDSFSDGGYAAKYVVHGVDLSHHNPIIDWSIAADKNITFGYIKATEGTDHLDRNYPYNYKQAKENGIKIGAYHFYTFGVSGLQQANHFIKTAQCKKGDLIPAIDVEHSKSNVYSKDTSYIALVVKELKNLEAKLYSHYGVHPVIYTNKDCYTLYVKNNFPENPIWMCDLHKEPSDKEMKNWIIWQFSHSGKIEGIEEKLDLNYFRYSFSDLKKYMLP